MKKFVFIVLLSTVMVFDPAYGAQRSLWERMRHQFKKAADGSTQKIKVPRFVDTVASEVVNFFPGGNLAYRVLGNFVGKSEDTKLDAMIDGLGQVADTAMESKDMLDYLLNQQVEEEKRRDQLIENLKKSTPLGLATASLEKTIKRSLNYADYLPGSGNPELQSKINDFLDPNRKTVNDHHLYLEGSRGALAASNLWEKDYPAFEKALENADKQEEDIEKGKTAASRARLQFINQEIKRLEGENEGYQESLKSGNLTFLETLSLQQARNNNNLSISKHMEDSKQLFEQISGNMLSEEEELKLAMAQADHYSKTIFNKLRSERDKILRDYRHLSLLDFN